MVLIYDLRFEIRVFLEKRISNESNASIVGRCCRAVSKATLLLQHALSSTAE